MTTEIDFKGKNCRELHLAILKAGQHCYRLDNEWVISNIDAVQDIIDVFEKKMPDLTPRQFKYMLAASGIYPTMDAVALVLQSMSLELYAQVVSQLDGGTVYFWQKSLDLCNQLKPLILQQNPNLNLDEANLRVLWTLASLN